MIEYFKERFEKWEQEIINSSIDQKIVSSTTQSYRRIIRQIEIISLESRSKFEEAIFSSLNYSIYKAGLCLLYRIFELDLCEEFLNYEKLNDQGSLKSFAMEMFIKLYCIKLCELIYTKFGSNNN